MASHFHSVQPAERLFLGRTVFVCWNQHAATLREDLKYYWLGVICDITTLPQVLKQNLPLNAVTPGSNGEKELTTEHEKQYPVFLPGKGKL